MKDFHDCPNYAFQLLKKPYKKAGEGLFIRVCSERTRGNDFKLK